MGSNDSSPANLPRRRGAWAAGAVALVLAATSGWWLNRPAEVPAPAVGAPAPSARATPGLPRLAAQTGAVAASVPAAPTAVPAAPTAVPRPVAQPRMPLPASSLDDALRKVRLALEGQATPKEMLEAATMLSACTGADMVVQSMYSLRDQQDPESQRSERRSGISMEQKIELVQDMQRRCQVFDAATLARRGELFKGAHAGGAPGSALPYLHWLTSSDGKQGANPELLARLKHEARQDVEDGDYFALLQYSFPFSTATYGLTEVQRQAYREAKLRITGEMGGAEEEKASRASADELEKKMAQWMTPPPPLSPEQQREADALAKKVVDAWRKRRGQGG